MADQVKLANGEILPIDTNQVSIREFRSLFDRSQSDDEEYAIIGKIVSKQADEIGNLGQMDYRRVIEAVLKAAKEPLSDPT